MLNPNQSNGCYFASVAYHAFILRRFYLYSDLNVTSCMLNMNMKTLLSSKEENILLSSSLSFQMQTLDYRAWGLGKHRLPTYPLA